MCVGGGVGREDILCLQNQILYYYVNIYIILCANSGGTSCHQP